MANAWHIDLGFDWNAAGTTSGGQTTYPLQIGVVFLEGGNSGTPVSKDMVDGSNGDTINVYIYDVTQNSGPAVSGSVPSVASGWFQWGPGDTRNSSNAKMLTSPAPTNYIGAGLPGGPTTGYSSIFSASPDEQFPYWAVTYQSNVWSGTLYNNTQNLYSHKAGTINTFSVTFKITVTNSGTAKTFSIDPEMIVDP